VHILLINFGVDFWRTFDQIIEDFTRREDLDIYAHATTNPLILQHSMMDSNHIFEADATLNTEEEERNGTGYRNVNSTGLKAAAAANGGYDGHLESSAAEDTPLLAGGADAGAPGSSDGETIWPGATDFEGLPWWKTPSVS
jgi:hypothetical protein